jgi:hypothetical protein
MSNQELEQILMDDDDFSSSYYQYDDEIPDHFNIGFNTSHQTLAISQSTNSQGTIHSGMSALTNSGIMSALTSSQTLDDQLSSEQSILNTFRTPIPDTVCARLNGTLDNIVEDFCWVTKRAGGGRNIYVCKCCGDSKLCGSTRAETHFTGIGNYRNGTWPKCKKFDHEIVQAIKMLTWKRKMVCGMQ